ncbi:MAG TPA: hypothetical protein GX708_02485 [Gallicola sp.]|nr:hypothetical protein [Gallicola sp.]
MKKIRILLCALVLVTLMVFINFMVNSDPSNYTTSITSYTINGSYVEYPCINGLKDHKKQEDINKLLEEQVLHGAKLYTGETFVDFSNPNLEYKFKSGVGLANKYIASFWYSFNQYEYSNNRIIGETYRFFCITIDMITGKEIKLPDFMMIDERLINSNDGTLIETDYSSEAIPNFHNFRDAFEVYTKEEERDNHHSFSQQEIIDILKDTDGETTWYIDKEKNIVFYFLENSVRIPYAQIADIIYPKYLKALKQ